MGRGGDKKGGHLYILKFILVHYLKYADYFYDS